jgi:hypothetical protein
MVLECSKVDEVESRLLGMIAMWRMQKAGGEARVV